MSDDPVQLEVRADPAMAVVVRRVLAALGAQAGLDVDRVGDLAVAADALVSAGATRLSHLRLTGRTEPGRVTVRVGPLPAGGADALRAEVSIPGMGPVLDRLCVRVGREESAEGERLVMEFGGPPGGARAPGGTGAA